MWILCLFIFSIRKLDYWLLDNENAGADPTINVYMDDNHALQAVFCEIPPEHLLTVYAYNQYNQPGYVPLYIDGDYVGTPGYSYNVLDGDREIAVESILYGGGYHVFQCYYYDGVYDTNNPTTLSITSDKTVIAYYYSY
jgi:hypothetical protein